jgi:hypothetical protein
VICFAAGTRILTAAGEMAVEDLTPGVRVATRFGGLRPVRWIGRQTFDGRFLGQHFAPVTLHEGCLGPSMPLRDLVVSADHGIAIDGHLVPARQLVNGVTITQTPRSGTVEFLHIDLGAHDLVMADGAWTESYLDMDNRNQFHNAADDETAADSEPNQPPQTFCLPQVGGEDPRLPALRDLVAAHIPPAFLTSDADLHIIADGIRIDAERHEDGTTSFTLPPRTISLRLASHATVAAVLGQGTDERLLGFCLRHLSLTCAGTTQPIALDDPALGAGFHAPEQEWRWTNGFAAIELSPRLGCNRIDPIMLTLTGFALPSYLRTLPAHTERAA